MIGKQSNTGMTIVPKLCSLRNCKKSYRWGKVAGIFCSFLYSVEPPILIWITWSYLLVTKIPHPLPPSTTIPVTWSNISSSSTSWQSNSIQYLHLLSFSDFENAFWEIFEIVSYSGLLLDRNPFPKKPYKENRNEFLKIPHINVNFFFPLVCWGLEIENAFGEEESW